MVVIDVLFEISKGFIYGCSEFWVWFTNPIITLGDLTVAPYMILSFTALIVVFGLVLMHLVNPLG